MVLDRTRELLFPITILVSVAVGVVIGTVLARSGSNSTSSAITPISDKKAELDAIDAVRAELTRVRETLERSASSSASSLLSGTRSPVQDPTPDLRDVNVRLAELVDALRAASARVNGDKAALIPPVAVDPRGLEELVAAESETINKTYVLWTYQQVMDRFGVPTSVSPGEKGVIAWVYSTPTRAVSFNFVDGRVAYVWN